MGADVQKYKEMEKRLTLMHDKNWLKTLEDLKKFRYDKEYNFSITYKKDNQKKNRRFTFQEVSFVEETNTFIFISYKENWETSELTDEVSDRLTIKDIEIINFNVKKPDNYTDLNGFN
ncbi:hypothetical protein NDQ57_03350 [Rossellomorea marisflavi]|uniref:hypothetical protein n=1 Tax=Rossellomorea marisflavi TaxID=189381 RepID=UPI00203FE4FD|nr:hypothetical protein [Rossellomorea marisflavi]MCM2603738.1 hypothetical protein [Rossellomorea marisflavi]